jgi:inhibitor of KinA sporulation pathway (predicted exonuclease)
VSQERSIVVLDVEATCWKKGVFSKNKETIELGAVHWHKGQVSKRSEFQTFVKPLKHPQLSPYCKELTGITQENVDSAPLFPQALLAFCEWMKPFGSVTLATWSRYDLWQLDLDLALHGLPKFEWPHLDAKKVATGVLGGMSFTATAAALGIALKEGRHRAIVDARVTAEILERLSSRRPG